MDDQQEATGEQEEAMASQSRAELSQQIARRLEAVRSAQSGLARETALHVLMRAEAELADLDRAAARPEFAYTLAAVPAN